MAQIIASDSNQVFVQAFASHFAAGDSDLNSVRLFVCNHLQTDPQKAAIGIEILKTAIAGQKEYYNTTVFGKIKHLFQTIIKEIFGTNTSLDLAEQVISESKLVEVNDDVTLQSQIIMARYFAIKENQSMHPNMSRLLNRLEIFHNVEVARSTAELNDETVYHFPPGEDPSNPSTVFIADKDGDVFAMSLGSPEASGVQRCYSKGRLFTNKGNKPIGVLSNKLVMTENRTEKINKEIRQINHDMKEEYDKLESFKEIPRINRAYAHFSIPGPNGDIGVTMTKYNEMNLFSFINSGYVHDLTPDQKICFMISLVTTLKGLHEKGYIHRDLKLKNVAIGADKKGNPIPILIDFVTCMLQGDKKQARLVGGTTEYWPPEYVNAFLQTGPHVQSIIAATTQKMDIWDLGLIFFQFFYGGNVIRMLSSPNSGHHNLTPLNKEAHALQNAHANLPAFIEAMQSETRPIKCDKAWKKIWDKIAASPAIWDLIILPMLSIDPTERPTMEDSLTALQGLYN